MKPQGEQVVDCGSKTIQDAHHFAHEAMATVFEIYITDDDETYARITTIKSYGAFADIGGIEGLIHISEMSWDHVSDATKIVKAGQSVMVKLLGINQDHSPPKIALGMKQLLKNPNTTIVRTDDDEVPIREEDNAMRKLREKFGNGPLKGGIG